MLLIRCPWCGDRDEVEFSYGGQAGVAYPSDPSALSHALPAAARDADTLLAEVRPVGDDLESVYAYLHDRARGRAR